MEQAAVSPAVRQPAEAAARLAYLQLILAIVFIAATAILFRLSELGPIATACFRTGLALPVLVTWAALERRAAARRGQRVAASLRRDGLALAAAGLLFAVNIANYAWAVQLTAIANASLLSNISPIFVALASVFILGEMVTRRFVAALVAALTGVAILTSSKLALAEGQLLGNTLAVLSSIFFAGYLVVVGRLRARLSSAEIMLWVCIISATALLVATVATGEALLPTSWKGWAIVLSLAFISYAIGQSLLTVAMSHVSATMSSVALLVLPVVTALAGWALLGEALGPAQVLGGAIILASIVAAKRAQG